METSKNEKQLITDNKKTFKEIAKNIINKTILYVTLILVGAVLTAFYFRNNVEPEKSITVFTAGDVSVSLTERSELVFINRDKGNPFIVDSTLTETINNMLAAREYVKINTVR
jgi:hypothetical protein